MGRAGREISFGAGTRNYLTYLGSMEPEHDGDGILELEGICVKIYLPCQFGREGRLQEKKEGEEIEECLNRVGGEIPGYDIFYVVLVQADVGRTQKQHPAWSIQGQHKPCVSSPQVTHSRFSTSPR